MKQIIGYILKNKDWMFSGIGVFFLSGLCWFVHKLFFQKSRQRVLKQSVKSLYAANSNKVSGPVDIPVPEEWHGILPADSKYEFKQETRTAIPLGSQSFAFEFAPQGHANPLILKNKIVRAEIRFTCRITNPMKACFNSNDFALNILPPKFLVEARRILESYSLSKLRVNREQISRNIVVALSPEFEKHGVQLESVSLGSLEPIGRTKVTSQFI